jgi:hypothetical protein
MVSEDKKKTDTKKTLNLISSVKNLERHELLNLASFLQLSGPFR